VKILFTGGSSFSGMWFVQELIKAGHEVTVVFRQDFTAYEGVRRQRVEKLVNLCPAVFSTAFGSVEFVQVVIEGGSWDLYCHHAADVTNYRSPDFDVAAALANNTRGIKNVLEALKKTDCFHLLLTGSVFEQREGEGSDGLRAVSPYGLSKGVTNDMFAFYTEEAKMNLGKFVIPNPFGPYEEGRFTTYLIQSWLKDLVPVVKAPDYIRDNIPISLLAKAYVDFAERFHTMDKKGNGFMKFNPSCYVGSQAQFTHLLSDTMKSRLGVACVYELQKQQDFNEPLIRVNTERLDWEKLGWNEQEAWDQLAEYYLTYDEATFSGCTKK
jgi:nucleoside-diphosphate-sugar epimerase